MRILLLAPELPYPPQKGTALRNFHLSRALATEHELHLITFGDPEARLPGELGYFRKVDVVPPPRRSNDRRLRDLLFSNRPDMAGRLASQGMSVRLASRARDTQFDLVQVEGIEMAAHYLSQPELPPLVYDAHNAEYLLQKRACLIDARNPSRWHAAAYSRAQWKRLAAFERIVCSAAARVMAVSEEDRSALRKIGADAQVVVPNGVDLDFYAQARQRRQPKGSELVFTGSMDFRPNVDAITWFIQRVLPIIARSLPEAHLTVVGANPPLSLRRLAGPQVTFTGLVPDVRPYLSQAAVYVVPLRMGAGVRFKVLEALAAGIPIVSTPLGAEGIAVTAGYDCLLAEDEASFAAAVVELLGDERRARSVASAGEAVAQRYQWSVVAEPLLECYRELAQEMVDG